MRSKLKLSYVTHIQTTKAFYTEFGISLSLSISELTLEDQQLIEVF